MSAGKGQRVTRSHPCPVCQKPDWCIHVDGGTICARTENQRRAGGAGWFHANGEERPNAFYAGRELRECAPDVGDTVDRYFHAHNAPQTRTALAYRLGVTTEALERLRVGWNNALEAYTFPMRDGRGRYVGIQNRFNETGDKRVMKGHRSGVFEPFELNVLGAELVVCEGASDTAAALSVGLEAIGRFSCSGTLEETVARIRRHRPDRVLVIEDNDLPGRTGARQLRDALDGIARVEIRTPPIGAKDLRDWIKAGASAGDIRKGAA